MRSVTSTKQRSSLISWQVCANLLITIFFFAPHPLVISLEQSEETKGKSSPPTQTLQDSFPLRPTIRYREQAKYTKEARDNVTHGTVALGVVFGADGYISGVRIISG